MSAVYDFVFSPQHMDCALCESLLRSAATKAGHRVITDTHITDGHGGSIRRVQEISLSEGVDIMEERGYEYSAFFDRWMAWLDRGDIVIIFQNNDLSHRECGHVMTMPWETTRSLPSHAPDHAATGLGWRYMPQWIITRSGARQASSA